VVDLGASHVKFSVSRSQEKRAFSSGKHLTPRPMVKRILTMTADWHYDAVTLGFPGAVIHGRPAKDPVNLGHGWTRFDFEKHFKKPVKIINDAAMQAIGSYRGGRMLFVGLGTGVGSALILYDIIVPLELGELKTAKGRKLGDVLGKKGLKKKGLTAWKRAVFHTIPSLAAAFQADYLVIGGGSVKHLDKLPEGACRGSNDLAFVGGARVWNTKISHVKHTWIIR